MDYPPTPKFAHLAQALLNWDIPLSSKPDLVVRLVYTHYKVQFMQLHSGFKFTLGIGFAESLQQARNIVCVTI